MKVCRYIENNNGHKIFEGQLVYFIGIKRYDGKKYTYCTAKFGVKL